MKQIRLNKKVSNNLFALVDDDMFDELNKHNWSYNADRSHAYRVAGNNGRRRLVLMHRQIMDASIGVSIDHINHNCLDNRKVNLRYCNQSQNNANRSSNKGSLYKGVFCASASSFRARISKDKKTYNLGSFSTPELAAKAYNEAAIKLFGEFALLNGIEREDY